jgi:hypothetical protein
MVPTWAEARVESSVSERRRVVFIVVDITLLYGYGPLSRADAALVLVVQCVD